MAAEGSPGHLGPGAEVQGAHGSEHLNAAHVLETENSVSTEPWSRLPAISPTLITLAQPLPCPGALAPAAPSLLLGQISATEPTRAVSHAMVSNLFFFSTVVCHEYSVQTLTTQNLRERSKLITTVTLPTLQHPVPLEDEGHGHTAGDVQER